MATESDWDIVKTEVSDDGYLPQHPLCKALARLEGEHNRLEETIAGCAERLHVRAEDLLAGVHLVLTELEYERGVNQRLRADTERLDAAQRLLADLWDSGVVELHDKEADCAEDDTCECEYAARFNAVLKGWNP